MSSSGLLPSFLAAIQASVSVLLVILYGVLTARFKLLDSSNGKAISMICVKVFLPALLLTKIGSELHLESAGRYVVVLVWAFICHIISFLIGIIVHLSFPKQFPDWITPAIMFNNTTSYPLLLIQSLDETGILSNLIVTDEATKDAIERAKSYFLVFSTISSCLTFAVGPRLMDSEHAPDTPDDKDFENDEDDIDEEEPSTNENTTLLSDARERMASVVSVSFFPSRRERENSATPTPRERRPSVFPKRRWLAFHPRVRWILLFLFDFLNAPLLGAVVGAIIGLVPALHRAFFNDTSEGGIFSAWLTASLKTVGGLFVPLPLIVAGVSLFMSYRAAKNPDAKAGKTPVLATSFVLVVRFVLWPAVSIAVIYALAKKTDIISDDPMLWFTLMLMPTGPPAMKLITMVQVSDADEEDEHKIAKILTISYIISPILALTVVGAMKASQAAIQ
ncbi:auxin efflux carrier [Aulographum hederae CBS 113979]|uniref:Auxin efflux carrier n=1 Tax=Aulographum hederae CBS 113979 TaxID=1176131 RepID=A0A6G1GQ20_9PEZI|nr:auxin efflux carrier [Aulographum hederae CBS 113979]